MYEENDFEARGHDRDIEACASALKKIAEVVVGGRTAAVTMLAVWIASSGFNRTGEECVDSEYASKVCRECGELVSQFSLTDSFATSNDVCPICPDGLTSLGDFASALALWPITTGSN